MGFFISDLHRQIEELHFEQFNGHHSKTIFTVYRGQGISKADLAQMTKTKGGLMAFNSFLSTSKQRDVSLGFARRALNNRDSVGILFIMTIDPSVSTTSFASTNKVGYFGDKVDAVLFSMHTVFRIRDIEPMGENARLFQVNLILTSDDDKDLRVLTDRMREESFPDSEGWYRLGLLLFIMGEFEKSDQVYQVLLKQTTKESEKASIYHQLGSAKKNQSEYEVAIEFFEKALAIDQQSFPLDYPSLAKTYNNIGTVYYKMGEYFKALSSYETALAIKQQSLPPDHLSLAMTYTNIGIIYKNIGEYSKALSYYAKDLDITLKSLPPNHPDLATSYNNIGSLYGQMGEYAKALPYLEKTLAIRQQSLPPNHPNLALSHYNIGLVYEQTDDCSKARSFYERAVDIGQHSLPLNHPDLQDYRDRLDRIKTKL